MQDKRVVITGVTSGIGESTALKLVERGAHVIGLGRDVQKLSALKERLSSRFTPIVADLTDEIGRADAFQQLGGRVDVLINNAAGVLYESPLKVDFAAWQRLFQLNLWAAIELTRAVVPRMEKGGHIVNLSSVTARHVPQPKFEPYALTKAALEHWTASLRDEVAARGVKVSLLVPGLVDTPIYDKVQGFERMKARLTEQVPRWLSPSDVADALIFLLDRPAHVAIRELVLEPSGQTH